MTLSTHLKRNKWFYLAIGAFIVLFFWFEVRPIMAYRGCARDASTDARLLLRNKAEIATGSKKQAYQDLIEKNMYLRTDYESFLYKCLLYQGIRPPDKDLESEDVESSANAN